MIWEGLTDNQLRDLLKDPSQERESEHPADRRAHVDAAGALRMESRRTPLCCPMKLSEFQAHVRVGRKGSRLSRPNKSRGGSLSAALAGCSSAGEPTSPP